MVQRLEGFVYSSWDEARLQVGEQYLLTSGLGPNYPRGSVCAVACFERAPCAKVVRDAVASFEVFTKDAHARGLAWDGVHYSVGGIAGPPGEQQQMLDVVRRVAQRFVEEHGEGGYITVPRCRIAMASGSAGTRQVLPVVEAIVSEEGALVACRMQMPLVPSVVRMANSMLSATVVDQRLVVYCPSVGNVHMSAEAHAAPLLVALTRVQSIARIALAKDSDWHDEVFSARGPFESLTADVQQWAQGLRYCRLYHCQSLGYDGGRAQPRGSHDHDAEHVMQLNFGYFY